jgi:hypothetical protein
MPFQRVQNCEDRTLGTGDISGQGDCLKVKTRICIKNTFFKEKLFTTEVQGILEGARLVRRL